jgi:hypothetical protein
MYYLKVRAWNHPGVGGPTYDYVISLFNDDVKPLVTLTSPVSGAYLPPGLLTVAADATDTGSGVGYVEFYWHQGDNWLNTGWQSLGVDTNGADGWSVITDTNQMADQPGAAIYAQAFDRAGNSAVSGAWNLKVKEYRLYFPLVARQ